MPYCPKCKYEYQSGTTQCPDCGTRLLEGSLPEQAANPDDAVDSVLLFKTNNYLQAQFLAGALEEAGIPYLEKGLGLADRLGGSAGGSITHVSYHASFDPAEIYVNPQDYERAKELRDSLEGAELQEDENLDEKDET